MTSIQPPVSWNEPVTAGPWVRALHPSGVHAVSLHARAESLRLVSPGTERTGTVTPLRRAARAGEAITACLLFLPLALRFLHRGPHAVLGGLHEFRLLRPRLLEQAERGGGDLEAVVLAQQRFERDHLARRDALGEGFAQLGPCARVGRSGAQYGGAGGEGEGDRRPGEQAERREFAGRDERHHVRRLRRDDAGPDRCRRNPEQDDERRIRRDDVRRDRRQGAVAVADRIQEGADRGRVGGIADDDGGGGGVGLVEDERQPLERCAADRLVAHRRERGRISGRLGVLGDPPGLVHVALQQRLHVGGRRERRQHARGVARHLGHHGGEIGVVRIEFIGGSEQHTGHALELEQGGDQRGRERGGRTDDDVRRSGGQQPLRTRGCGRRHHSPAGRDGERGDRTRQGQGR